METSKSSDGEIEEIKLARSLRGAPCATKQSRPIERSAASILLRWLLANGRWS
jgi:hypothetical protein